jgi:hypothetical protein
MLLSNCAFAMPAMVLEICCTPVIQIRLDFVIASTLPSVLAFTFSAVLEMLSILRSPASVIRVDASRLAVCGPGG